MEVASGREHGEVERDGVSDTLSTARSATHTSCLLKYQITIAQRRAKPKWNSASELDPLKHEDIPI